MAQPLSTSLACATAVLRRCGFPSLTVVRVGPIGGGMVSRVEEWLTDGEPRAAIAKSSPNAADEGLLREWRTLRWMRETTDFPSPVPYGCVADDEAGDGTYLLMERLPGAHLGAARVSAAGWHLLQDQLAEHLAGLHDHQGKAYGLVFDGERLPQWLDWFAPRLRSNYQDARAHLSPPACRNIERLLDELTAWLPERGRPTLVHGDIWHNNIIVDDRDPDRPRITGYIDGGGLFAEVEYELAYLLAFGGLVGDRFFRAYSRRHPLQDGFLRRCRVYWLNTMLLHLWLFGRDYLPRCEQLAREIEELP